MQLNDECRKRLDNSGKGRNALCVAIILVSLTATTARQIRITEFANASCLPSSERCAPADQSARPDVFAGKAPNPPADLRATVVSSSSLRLQWQNNSRDGAAFEIERCLGTTCTNFAVVARTPENVLTFTDTNLKANTAYRYRVRTLGKTQAVSAYSNIAGAVTPALRAPLASKPARTTTPTRGAPTAPSNLAATAVSTSQINLAWTNNSSNATGLYVERGQSATGPWDKVLSLPANVTSCANATPDSGKTYYYRVAAYNSGAKSAYSNIASATTWAMLPQGAPTQLRATTVSSTQINLSWTNNAGGATGIKIERCQGGGCSNFAEIARVPPSATSYDDKGLIPSMSYSYRVRAYNTSVESDYSNTGTANTARSTIPPTVPAGLIATVVSSMRINLTWTPSTSSGSEVAGYNVYQAGSRIATTVGTSYSVKGLEAKTQYCYTVNAFDRAGNGSSQSDPACATTKAPDDPQSNGN